MLLKRGSLRLFSDRHQVLLVDSFLMALNRVVFSASYNCGPPASQHQNNEGCPLSKKFSIDRGSVSGVHGGKNLNLKGCLDHRDAVFRRANDDLRKAHALALHRQFVRDTDADPVLDFDTKLINGQGAPKHGRPLGVPNGSLPEKLAVAVDVDEVLGNFVSALNKFIADRYHSNHSVSEYFVYEFFKVWNCSRAEADIRVHEFFKTSYFKKGIYPIPGARRVLDNLSPLCKLSIVTSRQNIIKDHTLEWIEKHYPGLFEEIHFGNHFALDGKSRPKSEICRTLGAQVLIDDNPRYALECAEVGIKVLLFDYDNSYPWSKSSSADLHPLVTKVHNWDEVEEKLLTWVVTY